MKKLTGFFVCALILICGAVYSQSTVATQLATHIAQKMKDTLNLTVLQRNQVFSINMYLHTQKTAARQQYSSTDSLSRRLQRIENKRDSLFHTILPEQKYLLYRQKKRNLVTRN